MAKAAPIENIDPNDPQAWFAEVLRVRFDEVLEFTDAALDPDDSVEGIHDMRVALRRLRSILRDLPDAAEKKLYKQFNGSLQKLSDALGRVRDIDVMIEAIEKLREESDPALHDGVDRIIEHHKQKRRDRHSDLERSLTSNLIHDLRTQFAGVERSVERRGVPGEFDSVRDLGSDVIADNLKQFRRRSKALYRPLETERLHKLRIAGKRLRYAIELFAPYFDEALEPFADGMKQMQSHLGSLHDHDTWIEAVREHVGTGSASDAVVWLISEFTRRRTEDYLAALGLWTEWERDEFSQKLADTLSK